VDWILYRSYITDTAKATLCYFYEMNMALHDLIPLTCPLCWRTFSATPALCQTPTKPFFVWHEVRYSLKGCFHLQITGHSWIWCSFLGEFTNLWKATIIFVMSVRLSARYNSAPTRRILTKFDIWVFFENLPRKEFLSKSDKNNEYFSWILI
jgi:hypothetical protein